MYFESNTEFSLIKSRGYTVQCPVNLRIYIANLAPIPEKSLIVMHIRTDRQKALETGKLKGVMNHEHS